MNTADIVQYLTFRLADELYAINVAHIREVLTVPKITRVPRMPPWLNGMINLRGNVIPVLDLRQKFGLGATPVTGDTSIIVTEITDVFADEAAESLILGIFSDSVEKVVDIEPGDIEAPPSIGLSIDTSFISGMGKLGDGFVIILRLDRILSEADLSEGLAEGVETAAPVVAKSAGKTRVAEGAGA